MEGGPDGQENGLIPRGINLIFQKIKENEKFAWKVNGGFCLIMIKIMWHEFNDFEILWHADRVTNKRKS